MFTHEERKQVMALRAKRKELVARASARPALRVETDLRIASQALGVKVPAWSPLLRLTPAELAEDDRLTAEINAIVAGARRRIRERQQAELNAEEVAKVRAGACPDCYATHAGECL